MNGVLVGTFEPLSAAWHSARAGGLGGSEIAAVLGLSPWESRFSLWHRKAGRLGPPAENEEMEWGKRLESAVVGKFADNHPELNIGRAGTYRHPDRAWQVANPDRLCYTPRADRSGHDVAAILEAKAALFDDEWGPVGGDQVPPYVRCQALWYCDTLGVDAAHVAVLIGGHDYREYTLHPDPADVAVMLTAGQEFIASVAEGRRPPIDSADATYQAIRTFHPDIDPVDVEIGAGLANDYLRAQEQAKAAEAEKRLRSSQVLDAIGTGRRAVCDREPIAVRVPGRGDSPPFLRPCRAKKASLT
ncbi:MAG: YqaJ viral recombinase family protein [Actinomycetota bacterium]|nr:YqaJ viral recombinase family protein [Actinomycetota bacterium]